MNYVSALLIDNSWTNKSQLKIDAIKSSDDDLVERLDKFFKKNQKDIEDWKRRTRKDNEMKTKTIISTLPHSPASFCVALLLCTNCVVLVLSIIIGYMLNT